MGKKKGPYIPYFLSQRDCEAWYNINADVKEEN